MKEQKSKNEELRASYNKKIDELAKAEVNQDQKDLFKKILEKADDADLQNIYQMLIQRVKVGFTFDAAPSVDQKAVALLVKDEEKSFINDKKNIDNQNILIIGENYDALKNLLIVEREREREKNGTSPFYDLIYIDPPYNTEASKNDGNAVANDKEDIEANKFIYRDKYSRNGWLNMLNERLIMARDLLKEDGVIFVSIDDTEHAYLKVLMDQIFGEENFISNFVWIKGGGKSDTTLISNKKEYILCYSKNINNVVLNKQKPTLKNYKNYDEEKGYYNNASFDRQGLKYSKKLDYAIEAPDGQFIYAGGDEKKWIERQNDNFNKRDWCWTLSKKEFFKRKEKGDIVFEKINGSWRVKYKSYHDNNWYPFSDVIKEEEDNETNTIIDKFGNQVGSIELKNIFNNNRIFDFPKSSKLIKFLINLHPNKNARILDFFAGSGTTGHAVLELNKEDDGNRSFTLVTNESIQKIGNKSDKTINVAIDVCYERLYRINNGKGTNNNASFEWLKKNTPYKNNLDVFNIKYYKTELFDETDSLDKIVEIYEKELKDFNVKIDKNTDRTTFYYDLLALKPIEKSEDK